MPTNLRCVSLAVVAGLLALPGCCLSKEWRDDIDRKRAAADREYVPFARQLSDVGRALPSNPAEKRCDDAKIKAHTKANHPSWLGDMSIVDDALLAHVGGGPAPQEGWKALRTGPAGQLKPPGASIDNASNMQELRRQGYFAVVRATVKQLPTSGDTSSFVGGRLDGFVIVHDVATMKPVCAAAVSARSSDTVKVRSRGLFRTNPTKALQDDFADNVHEAVAASVKRISDELRAAK